MARRVFTSVAVGTLFATTALAGAQAPAPDASPLSLEAEPVSPAVEYGVPLVHSMVALSAGALAVAVGVSGGALVGLAATPYIAPRVPSFVSPRVQRSQSGPFVVAATAAAVGMAAALPLALAAGAAVDAMAWVSLGAAQTPRQLLVLVASDALVLLLTAPALAVTATMMAAVAVAFRWAPDQLEGAQDRQAAVAVLGWGLPLVFLAGPATLSAGLLRSVMWTTLGWDAHAPPHAWYRRLAARMAGAADPVEPHAAPR